VQLGIRPRAPRGTGVPSSHLTVEEKPETWARVGSPASRGGPQGRPFEPACSALLSRSCARAGGGRAGPVRSLGGRAADARGGRARAHAAPSASCCSTRPLAGPGPSRRAARSFRILRTINQTGVSILLVEQKRRRSRWILPTTCSCSRTGRVRSWKGPSGRAWRRDDAIRRAYPGVLNGTSSSSRWSLGARPPAASTASLGARAGHDLSGEPTS